jgi:hypothetical protein
MAALLPALAWRYIHHMVPLAILLASAAVVALARGLARLAGPPAAPRAWRAYAGAVGTLLTLVVVALGCGMTIETAELTRFRVEGYGTTALKFPDLEGPARYLRAQIREGDVVLATDPFHVNHLLGPVGGREERTDYWLSSILQLPATIDDRRTLPLDRRDGTAMISSLEGLRDLFAREGRIWYVVQPQRQGGRNVPEVSAFIRQHMDVVYEDTWAMVLFRGRDHRPPALRRREDEMLLDTRANYLP